MEEVDLKVDLEKNLDALMNSFFGYFVVASVNFEVSLSVDEVGDLNTAEEVEVAVVAAEVEGNFDNFVMVAIVEIY